jgi:hypothetical protein
VLAFISENFAITGTKLVAKGNVTEFIIDQVRKSVSLFLIRRDRNDELLVDEYDRGAIREID